MADHCPSHTHGRSRVALAATEPTEVHLGGWQTCWKIPVDTFYCEEKLVCFSYDEEIRTNATRCVLPDRVESGNISTAVTTEGKSGTLCDLLGQGDAWCVFFRWFIQCFNALAILAGIAGGVLSDKVYATRFFNRAMGHLALISVALMWFVPWIIYRPDTASYCMPGMSCYFVMAGCALAHLGSYMSNMDIIYHPNTRRFGLQNDGLGIFQRVGAVAGMAAWALLAMAVCSHRWSETDQLGFNNIQGVTRRFKAVHFQDNGLSIVSKASWGLYRYEGPPLFVNSDAFGNIARLHTHVPLE
jgi:hypothetical protein